MQAHEKKVMLDDAVTLLGDACDTDDVHGEVIGRDELDGGSSSAYLAGYRDALNALQQLYEHGNPGALTPWLNQVREDMEAQQAEVDAQQPGAIHFWTAS